VCKFAHFEVYQNVALEYRMIKNQIDVEVVSIQCDALLSGDKREALAKFQKKFLQVVYQGLFQAGFYQFG